MSLIQFCYFLLVALLFSCDQKSSLSKEQLTYDTLIELGIKSSTAAPIDTDSAIFYFEAALELNQTKVEAWYGLGTAYSHLCTNPKLNNQNHCYKSIEYLKRAEEIDPLYRHLHYNKGLCEYRLGLFKLAKNDFNEQLQLYINKADVFTKSDIASAYYNLGLCDLFLGDTTAACDNFNESAVYNPDIKKSKHLEFCFD